MATMQDVSKLRVDHVLDLSDWNLTPDAGLIDALNLRRGASAPSENFFEAIPVYAKKSFLAASETSIDVPVVADENANHASFMIKLAVVLAVVVLVFLIVAIAAAVRSITP